MMVTCSFLWISCLILLNMLSSHLWAQSIDPKDLEQVNRILKEVPLFDGHNDLPWQMRKRFKNQISQINLLEDQSQREPFLHTDLPRLKKGGVQAQFWSVYVPPFDPAMAFLAVVEQIDVVKRIIEKYPNDLVLAKSAQDVENIHQQGKIASLIGMEGGHSMGHSMAALRQLYELGARYMTLTHNQTHLWADSAADEAKHGGLSPFGVEVIQEMNRLGMMVDLSHVSEDTMRDALLHSSAPVIFSHSATKAICHHHRNASDEVLKLLQKNQGVMMVIFLPEFLSCEYRDWTKAKEGVKHSELSNWLISHPEPIVDVRHVIAHIDHIKNTIGIDHIALGGDYDGMSTGPRGLEDVSGYKLLLASLLQKGYQEEEVKKIVGLNMLRVMKAVEGQSQKLKLEQGVNEKFGLISPIK